MHYKNGREAMKAILLLMLAVNAWGQNACPCGSDPAKVQTMVGDGNVQTTTYCAPSGKKLDTVAPVVTEVPMTRTVETCPQGYRLVTWWEPGITPTWDAGVSVLLQDAGYYPVETPSAPAPNPHPDRCVKK